MVTAAASEEPGKGAWLAVFVLCAAAILATVDQRLPFLLMEPIKASFHITDTQLALITGLSFSLSLVLFALPLSWVADRANRARLLTAAIFIWCVATIGCGFATGFWSLFILRMGVGLGEAALQPAAYSLLADLFPTRKLPRPLGMLALSSLIGNFLAQYGGGALYEAMRSAAAAGRIGYAPGDAWRPTLIVVGAIGLVIALAAVFLLRDPRAKGRSPTALTGDQLSFVAYLRASSFFYVPFVGAMCIYVMYSTGVQTWTAPFFARSYGWSVGEIGKAVGLAGLAAGALGVPFGIWLNRIVQQRMGRDAPVATIWVLVLLSIPFVALAPFAPSGLLAVVGLAFVTLAATAGTVVIPVVLTSSAPPHLRARAIAASNLCYGLLGVSLGPVAYGAFTDRVLGDPQKLYVTLSVLSVALMCACVAPLVLADRRYIAVRKLAGNAE